MSYEMAQEAGIASPEVNITQEKSLSFIEGVSMIVGTNIGAGILSIPFASRKAGFMPLLFWLILVGCLTTITMLYVAETTLRTKTHLQLSGLAKRYVGKIGAWAIFISVCVNSIGALIAYMSGSGRILYSLLGITPQLGSLLFFIPAVGVLYFGLKAIGRSEKLISLSMIVMIIVLMLATALHQSSDVVRLLEGSWIFMVPVFNVVVFCFSAQYIVPEIARGFVHNPKMLPKAILVGMFITFLLLGGVALSVISLTGLSDVTEVATVAWGQALGTWAFWTANVFALCAMLTSYWGLGGSFFTNIFDQFNLSESLDGEDQILRRIIVLAIVSVPPFILAYSGLVSFVNALYFAGTFSGVILSVIPILMVRGARKTGDIEPLWVCKDWMSHPVIQVSIIVLYSLTAVYAILSLWGYLPQGW